MTTFGFETEFYTNVAELITELSRKELAAADRLHPYHCDCDSCADLETTVFRAQRDSSCGGEIISKVFSTDDWDEATGAMFELQESALDVDASISTSCGLHIHLGNTDGSTLAQSELLSLAWLGVEPHLWDHVAGAAWAGRRGDQNALVSTAVLNQMMMGSGLWERHGRWISQESELDDMSFDLRRDYATSLQRRLEQMTWDRHSDLARAGHGGTYEVRIFNATRVAWRIEMACRLAVALVDPAVASVFAEPTREFLFGDLNHLGRQMMHLRRGLRRGGRQYQLNEAPIIANPPVTFETFMEVLNDHDERLGELLRKQTGYTAARKQVGLVRNAISNDLDDRWNHEAVLAAMQGEVDA